MAASIQVAAGQTSARTPIAPAMSALLPARVSAEQSSSQVKALAVRGGQRARSNSPFNLEDLYAVAEIAHHYLFSGGLSLALTLFDGLVAACPDEAYFTLGLGLTYDQLGDRQQALACYRRAAELDPSDPRPDINAAELFVEVGDWPRARQGLMRGANKARNRADAVLERKAVALLKHLETVA